MVKTVGVILLLLAANLNAFAFQCNVCHSKNPKMVKMHQALGYKDCFKCHGFKGKKSKEELKVQMVTDDLCKGCHLKQ